VADVLPACVSDTESSRACPDESRRDWSVLVPRACPGGSTCKPALRLWNAARQREFVHVTALDAKQWLPGTFKVEQTVEIPADFPDGSCELSVGMI